MKRLSPSLLLLALLQGACDNAACEEGRIEVGGRCVDPAEAGECGGPCDAHEFCDATREPNACVCVPGYEGDPCIWVGVVGDSGFLELERDPGVPFWQIDGEPGATLSRFGDGAVDPGVGLLPADVVCRAGGLQQVVEMPSYDLAEPLLAEISYQTEGVGSLGVGFGQSWQELPDTRGEWETGELCLGERAYGASPRGGPVSIRLSVSEPKRACLGDPEGMIIVDRFRIVPAPARACPSPGNVLNGDAEGEGGWQSREQGDGEADIVDGIGRDGTAGVRVARTTGKAAMFTRVSVPLPSDAGSPVLRFQWRATSGRPFDVRIGTYAGFGRTSRTVERLRGSNAELTYSYCLPPWTHGSVLDLVFETVDDGMDDPAELIVDDVAILRDPGCPFVDGLLDPGFESAVDHRWFGTYLSGSSNQAIIMLADGSPPARSGEGVLEMVYLDPVVDMAAERFVRIPMPDETNEPVLVFHSNVLPSSPARVQWTLGPDGSPRGDVRRGEGWQCNEVPLPSAWAGRWYRFRVEVGPTAGLVSPTDERRVLLDDFRVGSIGCPLR